MIVDAIDPGLSATIISFDLFKKVGGWGNPHSQQCTGSAACHVKGLQSESNSYWGPSEPHIQMGR